MQAGPRSTCTDHIKEALRPSPDPASAVFRALKGGKGYRAHLWTPEAVLWQLLGHSAQSVQWTKTLTERVSDTARAGWTTEQLQKYIASGQLQPSLSLLGQPSQATPATAPEHAAAASWSAFRNACKHPRSAEVPIRAHLNHRARFHGVCVCHCGTEDSVEPSPATCMHAHHRPVSTMRPYMTDMACQRARRRERIDASQA